MAKLTREELYALVWDRPMTRLAKEFGLSDAALHKICRKHEIPTPPLGYWAKKAYGKPVTNTPLPKARGGNSQYHTIIREGAGSAESEAAAMARARVHQAIVGRPEQEPDEVDDPILRRTIKRLSAGDHAVDLEWLKNSNILLVSAASDDVVGRPWPAYKCIYAEIEIGGAMHVLNAGKWFQVAGDFTALVNADFEDTPECPIELPEYRHGNENLYNLDVTAALPGSHCMDADLIMHGGGQSRIEFCDVLTPDRTLFHVKRYSGSAQLSHLFSQGVVSAELLLSDAEFRRKLNDKLPDAHKLADINARPDPAQYEVVLSSSANRPTHSTFSSSAR